MFNKLDPILSLRSSRLPVGNATRRDIFCLTSILSFALIHLPEAYVSSCSKLEELYSSLGGFRRSLRVKREG